MLSGLWKCIINYFWGFINYFRSQDTKDEHDREDRVKVKISTVSLSADSKKIRERQGDDAHNGARDFYEGPDKLEGKGLITDFSEPKGVIKRKYGFEVARFQKDNPNLQRKCTVAFKAERSKDRLGPDWEVTNINVIGMPKEVDPNAETHFVRFTARILNVKPYLVLKTEDSPSVHGGTVELPGILMVPNKKKFEPGPEKFWLRGDWVDVCLNANTLGSKYVKGYLPEDCVLEVAPLERKTVVGEVKEFHNSSIVKGTILVTDGISRYKFPVGSAVKCEAIESFQRIGEDIHYNQHACVGWRAISVVPVPDPFEIHENGKVPDFIYESHSTQNEKPILGPYPHALKRVNFTNYKEKLQVALWFEEIESDRRYELHRVVFKKLPRGDKAVYIFQAPAIHNFQPPLKIKDKIDTFKHDDAKNTRFQGTVTAINGSEVTCTFSETFDLQYTGYPSTVQFRLGQDKFRKCHQAVEAAYQFLGKRSLFPDKVTRQPPKMNLVENGVAVQFRNVCSAICSPSNSNFGSPQRSVSVSASCNRQFQRLPSVTSRFIRDIKSPPSCSEAKLEWFNSNLNEQQKNAVRRILLGEARPLPYIIFGPPGTGKTVTLVEAIMQVNKLDKNSRILVCAPSNAAADVLAEHLANSGHYAPGQFVWLNGYHRAPQAIPDNIVPFCTDGQEIHKVAKQRLIISTCLTAGQFFTLDLSFHFTHVFVDEAECCTEPETLIPTVLLRVPKGGQLILAGDPKQLGPMLMSEVSENCGLNISLLERLMGLPLYSRDENKFPDEKYNPLLLTKLVKNYRAHPTLLKLPSTLFYNDDLVAEAPFEEVSAFCREPPLKKLLVTEGVPIIFHGVLGQCEREDGSSCYNIQEALMVSRYVHQLKHTCGIKMKDIGIITPYRKQMEIIELALEGRGMNQESPKVASVEEFQGEERKVIIISTVRSMQQPRIKGSLDKLSFTYQQKKFNAIVTRAKELMIVIGDPHILWKTNYWNELLTYVIELNAYKGCNLPLEAAELQKRLKMAQNKGRNGELEGDAEPGARDQVQCQRSEEKQNRN